MTSSIINPKVVDLSHHDKPTDFKLAFAKGIRGIIHKATEGTKYVDPDYVRNRKGAVDAGMLWGAYHFFRPGDVSKQVDFFLKKAVPLSGTLLALDHEDPACTLADALVWLQMVEAKTGQRPILYSGHLVKEQLGNVRASAIGAYRLWLAQYSAVPVVHPVWSDWFLWQFTGDGTGPQPHSIPGLGTGIDINSYAGTDEDLSKRWIDTGMHIAVIEPQPPKPSTPTPLAVVAWAQTCLNLLGNVLAVDGNLGPKTEHAIRDYQVSVHIAADGQLNRQTLLSLGRDATAKFIVGG